MRATDRFVSGCNGHSGGHSETGWDWIISCYLSERREVANNETNPND